MSKATKRKHVVKEVLGDYITPNEKQQIMRIMGSNGNNLHEAVTESGEKFLLSMPTKFRKNIWIKRGDFVIVDPIEEGDKVKGEIHFILYRDHIDYLRKLGIWPKGFDADGIREDQMQKEAQKDKTKTREENEGDDSSDSEDEQDLFVNTNRVTVQYSESEEDSEDDEEDKDEEGEENF
ncbi:putative RNA-binding protein EIF1AD isoform 1-T3 [Clarias gariepinus]|uniref:probable RNA-binding protein EIF1AD n=1 Tax=Clarias gariepinus TaxID=13013 RepID=UPI00234E03D0|nr:probable RNA-binding protein EIF1AD [Clarias gariepinus]XP_053360997.1 probable RNA-binding protein EIF1AD [Clarias gariepinus]XP_053360998.1 probable RNA-binding protein EIF1AD [Clarias gariepinus]